MPLAVPPDTSSHGWRTNCHSAANSSRGLPGTMIRSAAPVVSFANSTLRHVLPPSAVRNTPRSALGAHTWPSAATTTTHRGPEVAELHVVQGVRPRRRGCGGRGRGNGSLLRRAATLRAAGQGECRGQEHAAETGLTESRAAHRANSFGGFRKGYEDATRSVGRGRRFTGTHAARHCV